MTETKLKILDEITKKFGSGAAFVLGEESKLSVETIPTGIIALDAALGIGGLPKGRIIELFGQEACYKTSLALHIVAASQKQGKKAALIDTEFAFNPEWAEKIGVNVGELIVSQPEDAQTTFEIIDLMVKSGEIETIVLDSVAAMVTRQELDGEFGDANIGIMARLMGQGMRRLVGPVSSNNVCLIMLNQERHKVGVMFGSDKTTTGGNALKYYAAMRIELSKLGQVKDGENIVGYQYKANIVKNKLSAPFRKCNFIIYFDQAFDKYAELVDLGSDLGIVKKAGAWYSYETDRMGQGRDNARKWLVENPEKALEIEQKIRTQLGVA